MRRIPRVSVLAATTVALVATVVHAAPTAAEGATPGGFDPAHAQVDLPAAVNDLAVDHQDRLLVVDRSERTLRRFEVDGTPDVAFGEVALTGMAGGPVELTVDPASAVVTVIARGISGSTVHRVADDGVPVSTFGDGGRLDLPGLDPEAELVTAFGDRVLVERPGPAGAARLEVRDQTGELDTGFDDDGTLDIACCGATTGSVDVRDVAVDGLGGSITIGLHGPDGSTIVRVHGDGWHSLTSTFEPSTPEIGVQRIVNGAGGHVWVVLVGAGERRVARLDAALALRPLGAGLWVTEPAPAAPLLDASFQPSGSSVEAGRLVLAHRDGAAIHLHAYSWMGVDASFGDGGRAVVPGVGDGRTLDHQVYDETADVAMTASGRFIATSAAAWGPGFFNPYSKWPLAISELSTDGQSVYVHRSSGSVLAVLAVGTGDQALVGFGESPSFSFSNDRIRTVRRWSPTDPSAQIGPVSALRAERGPTELQAHWEPPPVTPGQRLLAYDVHITRLGEDGDLWTEVSLGSPEGLPMAQAGHAYSVDVRARGPQGPAPWSGQPLLVVPPFASSADFATQVGADLGLPVPTPADLAEVDAALLGGTSPTHVVRAALDDPRWAARLDPMVRLYRAYFRRIPDHSGLRYWMGRRAAGTTVARASAVFADSSEFRRTYGSLSNGAFVALVYRNVLDRDGDPAGLAYWTRRLDRRATSRGHLMASFSESSEHVRIRSAEVATVSAFEGLLARVPTAVELDDWAGSAPIGDEDALVRALLGSAAYHSRT